MSQKIQGAQRDFSSGEIDLSLKRNDDHPARKTGLRTMSNARILNSGAMQNRPGRRALFPSNPPCTRFEKVTISPGNTFTLGFGASRLEVRDSAGVIVATVVVQANGAALPWSAATVGLVVYAVFGMSIYITYGHDMVPQVLSWDGIATWSNADYAEQVMGNQKRTPFYRISPQGITLLPSQQTGAITVSASAPLFSPAWVGKRIRFVGRQILITGYVNTELVNALVEETLPGTQNMHFPLGIVPTTFQIGDEVIGSVSGSKGIVVAIPNANEIDVQLLTTGTSVNTSQGLLGTTITTVAFVATDVVAGPGGSLLANATGGIRQPSAVAVWDEEVMNGLRGYPGSVFADQFRLGFCDFPSIPGGICWSAINAPADLYVGANPRDAIFEIAPDKVRVFHVVPGPESSEFVLCDRKLYYIKIDASNPLKPGSVGFQTLSSDGCAPVQPRVSQEVILYVNAGQNSVMAIVASGAFYRPFNTRNLTENHSHLFSNIVAIAVPTADGTFNERYAYVLTGNGTLAVGKYTLKGIQENAVVGWSWWGGDGVNKWVSAWNAEVLFTAVYGGATICETLDDNQYLDAAIPINSAPAAFAPPVGKGPLWWLPSSTVSLMDQGTRAMGTYVTDADGFIVPQNHGGEDLTLASVVAGRSWVMFIEPFCPNASPGADMHQRMSKRRIPRFAVHVINSSGFIMGRLFSGRLHRGYIPSPELGTLMNSRRFPAWNQGEDVTKPPPLRETVAHIPVPGSSFDPRVVIIKDTPGPLMIPEIDIEVTL